MNAKEIADAFRTTKDYGGLHALVVQADQRVASITQRLTEIDPGTELNRPAARRQAILEGPHATQKLDREIESLLGERKYLGSLASELTSELQRAEIRDQRVAYKAALPKVGKAIEAVQSAMAKFDAALADLDRLGNDLAHFHNLGERFPFDDDELATLLDLRESLWRVRTFAFPNPVDSIKEQALKFPRSFPLLYWSRGGDTYAARRPPTFENPLGYSRITDLTMFTEAKGSPSQNASWDS